jgi:hypothetical protein
LKSGDIARSECGEQTCSHEFYQSKSVGTVQPGSVQAAYRQYEIAHLPCGSKMRRVVQRLLIVPLLSLKVFQDAHE